LFEFSLELPDPSSFIKRLFRSIYLSSLNLMKAAQNVVGLDEICYVVDTLLLQLLYFKGLIFAILLNPFLDILPISRTDVSTIMPCAPDAPFRPSSIRVESSGLRFNSLKAVAVPEIPDPMIT
jgi:hypothetical protein